MLLQNTLDLSTFEIVRFRIWNQTSNPDDYGVGTKYFNTNSGHEGYNRENIYTATGWRKTAYLDDIEALTNGEGSLGTRVKALEDMLGLEDVTDVIDTWNDVKAFFANVDEGLNLMTMLNGKLDKTNNAYYGIDFNSTASDGTARLLLRNNSNPLGALLLSKESFSIYNYAKDSGIVIDDVVKIKESASSNNYKVLHEGNVGEYALKTDGSNAMTDGLQLFTMSSRSPNIEVTEGLFIYRGPSSGGTDIGLPDNYINVFNVGGAIAYSNLQLAWMRDHLNPALYARIGESTNYSAWKTIAFTDSDITGNAATATALKTAVNLWGNSFDGTQSLSNSLILDNNKQLRIKDSAGVSCSVVGLGSDNNLLIGGDLTSGARLYNMYLDGYKIYFRTGAKQTAMTITEEGNVSVVGSLLVASHSNALGANIRSTGVVHIEGGSSSVALGTPPVNGLTIGYDTKYALVQWLHGGNGSGNIQAMNVSGTATAYALNLNPLGGAVNVGGDLAPNANNSLSLGTSSYRWSNVYSVNGNFSGRILIGGAADNENYRLITNGAIKIGRSNDPATYLGITVSDVLTTFDGVDTSDGYMNYSFQSHGMELLYLAGRKGSTSYFRTLVGFNKLATFNGGALIPTGQTLTIGSVTFRETAAGEVEVDGNLHTTGTLASGGKAEEGENTTGNAMVYQYDLASGESVYTVDNVKGSTNVIVQIFEWNSNTSSWDMILTDVSVKADAITVTFGRTTTVNHMVTVC